MIDVKQLAIPILQAPIEATPSFAAAVSETGAVGSIQGTWSSANDAAEMVESVITATTRPFFVNFALALQPQAFEAVLEAGAPMVTLSWGVSRELIASAHKNDVAVGVQVGTAAGARRAIACGADFLICQGNEAGGHVQSTTTLKTLLAQTVALSKEVAVFAAGGLSDGADIAAMLDQGAAGAMLGTRFVATKESGLHDRYKQLIVAATGADTVYTVCFDGGWAHGPHRVLRNRTLCLWEDAGCPGPGNRPGEGDVLATDSSGFQVRRYASDTPLAQFEGQIDELCLYAGSGCGKITDLPSVAELVARLWRECQTVRANA